MINNQLTIKFADPSNPNCRHILLYTKGVEAPLNCSLDFLDEANLPLETKKEIIMMKLLGDEYKDKNKLKDEC